MTLLWLKQLYRYEREQARWLWDIIWGKLTVFSTVCFIVFPLCGVYLHAALPDPNP